MLIDEIKKANMQAMKDRDNEKRSIFSILISKYSNLEIARKGEGKEMKDADMLSIIQKTLKELDEELEGWKKRGDDEKITLISYQKEILNAYLPKQLTESEIKTIIESLPDKTMPTIMKHFKTNYNGQVDMSLVSKIAKGA